MASSARTSTVAVGKSTSCESISSKSKEDRSRKDYSSKYSNKQRQDQSISNRQYKKNNGNQRHNMHSKSNWSGRRNQVTQRRRDDFSSVPMDKKGIKKVNLNHLLNFTFENDESSTRSNYFSQGSNAYYPPRVGRKDNGHHTVFNKEQFIQANCQLIMKSGPDYSIHLADSDTPMVWENVEKINMWNQEIPSCPICLYPSYASRITKCGHIFCWPCILHYLALDDKTWRKCPICHEAIHKTDLKSVTVRQDEVFSNQCQISMRLMKRQRGSVVCTPASNHTAQDDDDNCFNVENVKRNHRYLVATPDQVLQHVVAEDLCQLECKLAVEDDEMEKGFIREAIKLCKERQASVQESMDAYVKRKKPTNVLSKANKTTNNNKNEGKEQASDITSTDGGDDDSTATADEGTKKEGESVFYFYQASDGQHIYLHPLNMKCLVHQFGSYERCPDEITAQITDMEGFSMSEMIRKRHRYMAHLPLSLEFRIAELDFRPPLVTSETLAVFQEAFEKRAVQRKKKLRNEKRLLRKLNADEMRKHGKYPPARIRLGSEQQFPDIHNYVKPASFSVLPPEPPASSATLQMDAVEHLESISQEDTVETISQGSEGTAGSLVGSLENQYNGPSFAQMLRSSRSDESVVAPLWPRLSRSATSVSTESSTSSFGKVGDEDYDPNYVPPPTYQSSFGDALSNALSQLNTNNEAAASSSSAVVVDGPSDEVPSGSKPAGSKKKKKGGRKKVLLFSTAGQQHQ